MSKFGASLMVFGAMVFWLPMIADPYMTPRLLLVAAGACILLVTKSNIGTSLETPIWLMISAVVVSAVFAQDWRYAIIGSYQFGMDSLLAAVCYGCVLLAGARSGFSVRAMARMVVIASIPMSAYGIFQRFFHDPLIWQNLPDGARVASTQGGPIFLGAVLAVAILCAIHLAKSGDRTAYVALALALPCLWFTQTRGAMLAVVVGLAFMHKRLALAAIPAFLVMPRLLHSVTSDMARFEVWKIALRTFLDNPLTGYGPGNFYLSFRRYATWDLVDVTGVSTYVQAHAHNDFLHVMATLGILGLVAYVFLGYSIIRMAMAHAERKFLLSLIAAYFVLSAFNPATTSVLVILALVYGAASSRIESVTKRCVSPALAALVVALFVGRLTLADYHYAKAGVARNDPATQAMEYQEAARLNPWEMFYSCRQVDSIIRIIPYMPLDQRRNLAKAARDLAMESVLKHPMDSYAHELLGKQILIGHIAGYRDIAPAEALRAFNRAQELAPTFEVLMWRRRATARELDDLDQVEDADQDIANLRKSLARARKA